MTPSILEELKADPRIQELIQARVDQQLADLKIPRFIVPPDVVRSRYVVVVCTGHRKNGRSCNRRLGDLNINHPHDVRYTCRDCGSEYILQKPC